MELYFNAASAISPIGNYESDSIKLFHPDPSKGFFECTEPDYKKIIDKKYLRRMSKFIKFSVANAMKCLADAGIEQPDALITGTALGCVADTVDFLQQINANAETLLNPTAFMQSTHNTASGQIALLLGCKNFNVTFSQKNTSFESALLQAEMMFSDGIYQNILVGGMDEITPESYQLISKTYCFNRNAENPFLPGEGAAFFVLSNQKSEKSLGRFDGLSFYHGEFSDSVIPEFLKMNELSINNIGVFLTGAHPADPLSGNFAKIFDAGQIIRIKEFCGEYDTSSAFALWLALQLLNRKIEGNAGYPSGKILIHNQGSGSAHSLILVSGC